MLPNLLLVKDETFTIIDKDILRDEIKKYKADGYRMCSITAESLGEEDFELTYHLDLNYELTNIRVIGKYSEEIPSKDVSGKGNNYKCRKNWFHWVTMNLQVGVKVGYSSQNIEKLCQEWLAYAEKTNFHKRLTTKEDIQKGNEILDAAIKDLEARLI